MKQKDWVRSKHRLAIQNIDNIETEHKVGVDIPFNSIELHRDLL